MNPYHFLCKTFTGPTGWLSLIHICRGGYVGNDGVPRLNVLDVQMQIRRLPKPVIAMVNGYATVSYTHLCRENDRDSF